jgi:hypothetical protein
MAVVEVVAAAAVVGATVVVFVALGAAAAPPQAAAPTAKAALATATRIVFKVPSTSPALRRRGDNELPYGSTPTYRRVRGGRTEANGTNHLQSGVLRRG